MNKKTKKGISHTWKIRLLIIAGCLLVVMAGVLIFQQMRKGKEEHKVTILVQQKDGSESSYIVKTTAGILKDAMDAAADMGLTYEGTETEEGYLLLKLNEETADYETNQAYWALYVNGNMRYCDITAQTIENDDIIKFVYSYLK